MKMTLRGESAYRLFRCAAICLEILVVLCISCFAASITDGCKELPQGRVQELLEDICDWQVTDLEPRKTNYDCFAIRQDQYFALGYNAGCQRNRDEIAVFDASGRFLYSIVFENNGSFSLMWEGDTLLVHDTRSGYIFSLDQNGACTAIYDSDDDYEIAERFRKNSSPSLHSMKKGIDVNGCSYLVSGNRIERKDPSGQTTVLYQAKGDYKLIPWFFVLPFLAIWLFVFIKRMNEYTQRK